MLWSQSICKNHILRTNITLLNQIKRILSQSSNKYTTSVYEQQHVSCTEKKLIFSKIIVLKKNKLYIRVLYIYILNLIFPFYLFSHFPLKLYIIRQILFSILFSKCKILFKRTVYHSFLKGFIQAIIYLNNVHLTIQIMLKYILKVPNL